MIIKLEEKLKTQNSLKLFTKKVCKNYFLKASSNLLQTSFNATTYNIT